MAASVPSFFSMKARGLTYLKRCNTHQGLQVIKVQSYQDEGRSTNMVDGNLNVLKERIKMVKVKERLERCCKCQHGWNYNVPLNSNHKRNKACNFIELMGLVCGTLGLTCFGGTLFLCLVSLLVHLQEFTGEEHGNATERCRWRRLAIVSQGSETITMSVKDAHRPNQ